VILPTKADRQPRLPVPHRPTQIVQKGNPPIVTERSFSLGLSTEKFLSYAGEPFKVLIQGVVQMNLRGSFLRNFVLGHLDDPFSADAVCVVNFSHKHAFQHAEPGRALDEDGHHEEAACGAPSGAVNAYSKR